MLKKYHAKRTITVDGKTYNSGDIVMAGFDLPGLERIYEPEEVKIKKKVSSSPFFGKENPVISVIVTFHNQEQFIRDCLNGFICQTVKVPYEIIAVVDKSDQGEAELIQKEFPGVLVFKSDAGNACVARNRGIIMSKGTYLAFFDGDDYPFGQYLEKLFDAVQDADFSYSRFEHIKFGYRKGILPRCNIFEWSDSWSDYSPITNTPIMIRKERAPLWDERFELMQDAAYCLAMKQNGLKGKHVREELWHYRVHSGNAWGQKLAQEKRMRAQTILKTSYGWKGQKKANLTFVSLISRDVVLDEYFNQLKTLGMPSNTHWLIIVDSNSEQFIDKIKGYQKKHESLFLSSRMFVTGEDSLAYCRDFESRGMRIANFIKIIINDTAKKFGGTPYLFMVEDDTLAPKDAFKKLEKLSKKNLNVAYASGIECGRGYTRHTGVCTLTTDDSGEIIKRHIPKMQDKGIIPIQGGGWYCWIGNTEKLLDYINQRPMRCYDGKMLGPDVMMVYDLREMGYECYCDLSVQCQHYDERGKKWLDASIGKGWEIDYYQDADKKWKMNLNEITD